MAFYLETSAFLKLLVTEVESEAMRTWFVAGRSCWSSHLLPTEALRAAQRLGLDTETVETTLDAVSLVLPAASTFPRAATMLPSQLRALDALHLATAVELGDDLEAIVSYDVRLLDGAGALGLPVVSPA